MKIDTHKFFNEIGENEKILIKSGGSAWRSGIKEGFNKVKLFDKEVFESEEYTLNKVKDKLDKELGIHETINAWKGCGSFLGEEVEWFNGLCKVYDVTLELIEKCIIE